MDINKPRFELTSIYSDGSAEEPKIVPIQELPLDTNTNRRGFLGAGLVAGAALTLLVKSNLFAKSVPNINLIRKIGDDDINAHCEMITALSISPDEKILASGAYEEKQIKLWSLPQGKLLKKLSGHTGYVKALAISPDGKMLASGSKDKTIKLWSLPDGQLLKTLKGHSDAVLNLSFTLGGKILISGSEDKTIKLWSIPAGNLLKILEGHTSSISELFISYDGTILATTSSLRTIGLWSLPEGNSLRIFESNSDIIDEISFSWDSKILAIGSRSGVIELRSLPDGNLLKTIGCRYPFIKLLSFIQDTNILLSIHGNGIIDMWSVPSGEFLKTLYESHLGIIRSSISTDGKMLACGLKNDTIDLLSIPEGESLGQLKHFSSYLYPHFFSFNTKLLVSSTYKEIRLWDLEKKEFNGFLFDPTCNETKGVTYNVFDKITNTTRTYTLTCGSPVPAGATCTCNCVAGTYKPTYAPSSSGSSCTCNRVCTCIPVCQAHKLLHPDKFVRSLSREILLFMGVKEIDYMQWAAANSKAGLRTAIISLIKKIQRGVKPNYLHWPAINECKEYLQHNDEVVSVMAAQMINLQTNLNKQVITEELCQKVKTLLTKSKEMHWKKKLEHGYK